MGNDDILIPGKVQDTERPVPETQPEELYLKINEALSELTNGFQETARENLDVYSKSEVDSHIIEKTNEIKHHAIHHIKGLESRLEDSEKEIQELHDQLDSQLEDCFTKNDHTAFKNNLLKDELPKILTPYLTLTQVNEKITESLIGYVESSQVYKKDDVYTKTQIKDAYVKKDGSTPFTSTQQGVYPKFRKDLATKGYSDDCIKQHKEEADPHHFISRINDKLNNYCKRAEVYTRAQTYNRDAIDAIIDKLVKQACDSLIQEHVSVISHLTSQDVLRIVKAYAFENLLSKDESKTIIDSVENIVEETSDKFLWRTSGPVESSVGFVEDNSELQSELTLQEIMDAIFYGKAVSVTTPEYVEVGKSCDITICIHGSIASVDYAELWQGDTLIRDWSGSELTDFDEGCITIQSNEIIENTEFIFKVHYTNDTVYESSDSVKISYPIFAGLFPYWKAGTDVTWDYLKELLSLDSKNNGIFDYSNKTITINYQFVMENKESKKPVVIIPDSWEYDLNTMNTNSQSFEIDSFDLVILPMQLNNKTVVYKIYIFKQPQAFANQQVTFNFKLKE